MPISLSIRELFQSGHIRAILLDHAGVLTRVEDLHGEARKRTFNRLGCTITAAEGKSLMGFGEKNLFAYMQAGIQNSGILGSYTRLLDSFKRVVDGCNSDPDIFQQFHHTAYLEVRSQIVDPLQLVRRGMPEMLLAAHEHNIPVGVVSNSERDHVLEDIALVMERLNQLCFAQGTPQLQQDDMFKVILTATDMRDRKIQPKDSPAPYLHGILDLMAVAPSLKDIATNQVYVVEDSKKGFDSADRAGTLVTHVHYEDVDNPEVSHPQPRAFAWVKDSGTLAEIELNPAHPATALIKEALRRDSQATAPQSPTGPHP